MQLFAFAAFLYSNGNIFNAGTVGEACDFVAHIFFEMR